MLARRAKALAFKGADLSSRSRHGGRGFSARTAGIGLPELRRSRPFVIKEGEFEFELMGDNHSLQEWM